MNHYNRMPKRCPRGTFTAVNPHLLSFYRGGSFYEQVGSNCWRPKLRQPYYSTHLFPYAVETPYSTIPINPLTRTPLVNSASAAHNRGTNPTFTRHPVYTKNFPDG